MGRSATERPRTTSLSLGESLIESERPVTKSYFSALYAGRKRVECLLSAISGHWLTIVKAIFTQIVALVTGAAKCSISLGPSARESNLHVRGLCRFPLRF